MKKALLGLLAVIVILLMSGTTAQAQKGLYAGAGIGSASMGGNIGDEFNPGMGYQFLLGFKPAEKWAVELEYQVYAQEPENEALYKRAGYGGFDANLKYFFGRSRPRVFRPYLSAGIGFHALAWETEEVAGVANVEKEDAVGAIALMPGLGCEVMVGRIAALNLNGRVAFNMWADETTEGIAVPDDWSGNTLILTAGLVLHL